MVQRPSGPDLSDSDGRWNRRKNGRLKEPWTQEEIDHFVKLLSEGASYRQVGEVFGISHASAQRRARKLGVSSIHPRRAEWSKRDIERLMNFLSSGKRIEWICERLGRSEKAIKLMASRLGLSRRGHHSRWSNADILIAARMYREGYPHREIAKKLKRTPDTVKATIWCLRRIPTWLLPDGADFNDPLEEYPQDGKGRTPGTKARK